MNREPREPSCRERVCIPPTWWSGAEQRGALEALAVHGRRRKKTAEEVELERLRRQDRQLQTELAPTKAALDIVGKAHALLEQLSESADTEPRSKQ